MDTQEELDSKVKETNIFIANDKEEVIKQASDKP